MLRAIIITVFCCLIFLNTVVMSLANVWPLSGNSTSDTIDSDYGPRKVSVGSSFHYGLDLRATSPLPIHSIKSDSIVNISLTESGTGGIYIQTSSGFRYMHLSKQTSSFEIKKATYPLQYAGAIYVVFKNPQGNATKIISTPNNDGRDLDNWGIKSKSTISEGEIFVYSGNSGSRGGNGYPYHLHIDKGQHGPNPLRSLTEIYTASPSTISFIQPTASKVPAGNIPIVVEVKSGPDFDLNEVKISIDGIQAFQTVFDPKNNVTIRNNDGSTGIHPISNGKDRFIFIWKTNACTPPTGKHIITVETNDIKNATSQLSKEIEVLPSGDDPGCDHPDDNFSVATIDYESLAEPDDADDFSMTVINPPAKVSLLQRGKSGNTELMLNDFKESYELRPIDFAPSILSETPLLIIPSGGLSGLKNSDFFKSSLNEYVKQGGTLIVFAQQHGYDLTAIPTPGGKPIVGYGWAEDQNCFTDSVSIESWHQMLSGQSRTTPTLNVDGYFTGYPANSTILLRRTANGQPALLMYEHGLGRVIVTSMYSDWAYGHGQTSQEEIAIVRDMLSWAKKPAVLPEVKPGETASLPVAFTNSTATNAGAIKIQIWNPDRSTLLSEQTVDLTVLAGQSVVNNVAWQAPTNAAIGIYHIDNILLDDSGNIIHPQAETDSGRFVVSSPPQTGTLKKDIWFSVSTTSQNVFYQDIFDYTFHIFNNTSQPRNLTVKNLLKHTGRTHEWKITANPNSETAITGSDQFIDSSMYETMASYLYDEAGKEIGDYELSFKGRYPSVKTTVKTDKSTYSQSETVQLSIILENSNNVTLASILKIQVVDPVNNTVFVTTRNIIIGANGMNTDNLSFPLPQILQHGSYTVVVQGYDQYGSRIGGNATAFEVPYSETTISSSLPPYYTAGTNALSFNLANVGRIPIAAGTFELNLKDPDGIVVTELSEPFALDLGQSRLLNMPIIIPQPKFGTYSIGYKASDETKVGNSVTIPLSNTAIIDFTPDSLNSRIREVAGSVVTLTNTGKFVIENALLTFSVPDINYTDTRSVTVSVGQKQEFRYQFPVPATLGEGSHVINITLTLPSGGNVVKAASFFVTPAILITDYSGALNLAPGDLISLTVENSGGVDAAYVTDKLTLADANGKVFFEGSAIGSILAGEKKSLTAFPVPLQATSGPIVLSVIVKNTKTGSLFSVNKNLIISGLEAGLSARTDKAAYLLTEPITAVSSITNGAHAIEGGTLDLTVTKYGAAGEDGFRLILPLTGWIPLMTSGSTPTKVTVSSDGSIYVVDGSRVKKFDRNMSYIGVVGQYGSGNGQYYRPTGVAAGPDGSLYVISDSLCRILKYDRNGLLLIQKGTYCNNNYNNMNDGEFNAPSGITVAADGAVYVSDRYGDRIQKFDSSLNFISKWGTQGSGNGQFIYPEDVAAGPDGSIYVADSYNHRIQKFDGAGNFIASWGSVRGNGEGQFDKPMGVTVSPDGAVYVTDSHRIQKFDANGTILAKIGSQGSGDGQFYYPRGIAVSGDGSIYVADSGNNRLMQVSSNLQPVAKWGTLGSDNGHFNAPRSIAFGPDGSKYVADTNNHRIQKFDCNGNFILKWGSYGADDGQFKYPGGIAVGPDGSVYVAEGYNYGYNNRIQKFDANGNFVSKWGSYGSANGQFYKPNKISVSSDGFVYVLDYYAIQKFDSNGTYIGRRQGGGYDIATAPDGSLYLATSNNTISKLDNSLNIIGQFVGSYYNYAIAVGADGFLYVTNDGRVDKFDANGTFISSFNGDFNYPKGLAVAADGTLFVADTDNHRILKMTVSSGFETLFKTALPVSLAASSSQDYNTIIGALTKPGKMFLAAELKNSLGQLVAKSEYPFYVLQGTTLLTASTDKKVYRPGETVTITGEVQNLAAINVAGASLNITRKSDFDSQNLLTSTIDISANGKYPFSVTTTAGTAGVYSITGKVVQNNATLTEISDQYEVASPKVAVTLKAPDIVGNEPFAVTLSLANDIKSEATITIAKSFDSSTETVTIPAGQTRLLQYSRQISADTVDTFTVSGDLTQVVTKTVKYGPAVVLAAAPQPVYPEGIISLPVTVANNGLIDSQFTIDYQLKQGANSISHQAKEYFLAKGAGSADTLLFDLAEGNYQLAASSWKPVAGTSATFQVRRNTKGELTLSIGPQTGNLLPATVNVVNLGFLLLEGSVRVSLVAENGGTAWTATQDVSLPQTLNPDPRTLPFAINLSALKPGSYTLRAELLDGGNRQLALQSAPYTILGPIFVISQLPQEQTVPAGDDAVFNFRVKNNGNQEGAFDLSFKADDLIDSTRTEWLKPGEEKEIAFSFTTAADLEEKDYFATYTLKQQGSGSGEQRTVKYRLQGLNLAVTAALERQAYSPGDTATLTLTVTQQDGNVAPNLFARVNYGGYNEKQNFTLTGSQTLVFSVPLSRITGEKLFYGIYAESGRSIHLNTIYIYKANTELSVATDKQVYNPGETVTVAVSGSATGDLTLTGPGGFVVTFTYNGSATKSFTLPAIMTAGTYTLNSQLKTQNSQLITASYPFDVAGIQVKVKEALLDKAKYAATDTMQLSLNIESNRDLATTVRTWVVDPAGTYTPTGEAEAGLTSASPSLFTLHPSLFTLHRFSRHSQTRLRSLPGGYASGLWGQGVRHRRGGAAGAGHRPERLSGNNHPSDGKG